MLDAPGQRGVVTYFSFEAAFRTLFQNIYFFTLKDQPRPALQYWCLGIINELSWSHNLRFKGIDRFLIGGGSGYPNWGIILPMLLISPDGMAINANIFHDDILKKKDRNPGSIVRFHQGLPRLKGPACLSIPEYPQVGGWLTSGYPGVRGRWT
jgi:hypothetical protein